MTMNAEQIHALSQRLAGAGAVELDDTERQLVADALTELARAQSALARQERLLLIETDARGAIERIAREALASTAPELRIDPAASFDFAAAAEAREKLLEAIERARTGRAIIEAALGFARDVAVLAG